MKTELYVLCKVVGLMDVKCTVYVDIDTNNVRVCGSGGKWINSALSINKWLQGATYIKVLANNFKEK